MKKALSIILVLIMCLFSVPFFSDAASVCTIKFNANGGAGALEAKTVRIGQTVDVSAEPAKDGMTFMGWALSEEDARNGKLAFEKGDDITAFGNAELYAAYSYTVTLKPGPEGWGGTKTLYKYEGTDLDLLISKSSIHSNYGMLPGKQYDNYDQRVFIEWNTAYDSETSRGIGTAYMDKYTANANATLYAIWGYKITFNADGGIFPSTGTGIYRSYVANYDGSDYENPKTVYGNFGFPDGKHGVPAPVKAGCTLASTRQGAAFLLLNSNMTIFTTETAEQNLTIPPVGGSLTWSQFHTTIDEYGDTCVEFYAAWNSSVRYDANGGTGGSTDQLKIAYGNLYQYETYTIKTPAAAGVSRSGYTFKGWDFSPNGDVFTFQPGNTLAQLGNSNQVVLYAIWQQGGSTEPTPTNGVTITYDANGGTGAPAPQVFEKNVKTAISSVTPTRVGYTFKGWGERASSTTVKYYPGQKYSFKNNTTIYAIWTKHTNHNYVLDSTRSSSADCGNDGVNYYVCSTCGYSYSETIPATGSHNWVKISESTASCGFAGVVKYECSVCKQINSIETPPTGNHTFATIKTVPATCGEDGYISQICVNCSTPNRIVLSATGNHTYELTETVPATCVDDGSNTYTCSVCGDAYSETIQATGIHTYELTGTVPATCVDDGSKTYACSVCGDSYSETIFAVGEHSYVLDSEKPASCTEQGSKTFICSACGDSYTETVEAFGHSWGEWVVTTEPAVGKAGQKQRVCANCAEVETEVIPALPGNGEIIYSIENYDFTIYNAAGLNYIRYAPDPDGVLKTTGDIKNADGMVAVRETYINANRTEEGSLTFKVVDGGRYSFWFRFDSGVETVLTGVDVNNFTVSITEKDGPRITVNNLYGVKDFFIVRGHVNTYREIKYGDGRIVRYDLSTQPRKSVTYGIPTHALDPNNEYTLFIRYLDSSKADRAEFFTLDLPEPELTVSGLQIRVSGLAGLRTIRTAPGHLETTYEIKTAVGARNFSAKTFLSGGRTEMGIQYRTDGEYSLVCVYSNGYEKIFHFTIRHLKPTVVLGDHSITFGDLDRLDIIRYAPGHITEPASIKNTAGSRYLKSPAIDENGKITISGLGSGEYTFLVQYTDESQNMYYYSFD